ncbi:MAG: hypothetical protein ACUZ77_06045 [Candidatus Brocadiales bacterium]
MVNSRITGKINRTRQKNNTQDSRQRREVQYISPDATKDTRVVVIRIMGRH